MADRYCNFRGASVIYRRAVFGDPGRFGGVLAVWVVSWLFRRFSGCFGDFPAASVSFRLVVASVWTFRCLPFRPFSGWFSDFGAISALFWPFGTIPAGSAHFCSFLLRFGGFLVSAKSKTA